MPEIKVEKAEKQPTIERWWSSLDPSHRVVIDLGGGPNSIAYLVVFYNYSFEVDLSTDDGKRISRGLHDCGREGRDLFVIGNSYSENEIGDKVSQMKLMRTIASGHDGSAKIRGLFSRKELVDAGINPASEDVDELIMLALKRKKIIGEIQNAE